MAKKMPGKAFSKTDTTDTRLTIRLNEDALATLEALAAKKHTTKSEMARRFIEKGLLVDGYAENMDAIERQLEKVVERTIVPRMEREIKLTVKGIIASAAGYFLTARVLEGLVPPEYQEDYQEALAEARRKGIEYVKLNAREMEEQLKRGLFFGDDEGDGSDGFF